MINIDGTVEISLLRDGTSSCVLLSSSSSSSASRDLPYLALLRLLDEDCCNSTSLPKPEPRLASFAADLDADALAEYARRRWPWLKVSASGKALAWSSVVSRSRKLGKKRVINGFMDGPHAVIMAKLTSIPDEVPARVYIGSGLGPPK